MNGVAYTFQTPTRFIEKRTETNSGCPVPKLLLVLLVVFFLYPAGAFGQTLEPIPNVFTSTGGGEFGYSVATQGDIMVVGAPYDDGVANNAGAAFVHGRNVGGANAWGLIKRLEPNGADVIRDEFGSSVAIDGDTIVVGARDDGSTLQEYGKVYIYQRDQGGADNWGEVTTVRATQLGSYQNFGESVAIEGDTLVVGAGFDQDDGAAYVFERDQGGTDNWGPITRIRPQFLSTDARFGADVDISGDVIAVGAPDDRLANLGGFAVPMGSVFLYERNEGGPNNWGEIRRVVASDRSQGDRFGDRISIDGDRLAVGAYRRGVITSRKGAVYISERDEGGVDNWGEVIKLSAPDAAEDDLFGRDVLLQGDRLLVGATFDDDGAQDSGSVYEFDRNLPTADSWGVVKKLQAFDPALGDLFGFAIAADGSTIVVGAHNRNSDSGGVYVTGPAPNFAPEAIDQTVMLDEDTTAQIMLDANDTDPLTFSVVMAPQNGTLTGTAPDLVYTPDPDFFGSDSFTFTADDGVSTSAPGTVTIEVAPINDAPIADDISRATVEGQPIAVVLSGSDVESDPLTFEVIDSPSNGALTGTAPQLTYTPDPGFSGEETFTYVSNDGDLDSSVATVTIRVNEDNPDNRAPSAQSQVVDAVAGQARAIVLNGSDPDGDGIQFSILQQPGQGTLTGAAPNLSYTAPAGFEGTDTFTFEVSDGALTSAAATVTIEVTLPVAENTAPVFVSPDEGAEFEATIDEELLVDVEATDADGDTLTYSADGLPAGAALDSETGELTWTPSEAGSFGVVLRVTDGTAEVTRSITLRAVSEVVPPASRGGSNSAADEGCCSTSRSTPASAPMALLVLFGALWVIRRRVR